MHGKAFASVARYEDRLMVAQTISLQDSQIFTTVSTCFNHPQVNLCFDHGTNTCLTFALTWADSLAPRAIALAIASLHWQAQSPPFSRVGLQFTTGSLQQ